MISTAEQILSNLPIALTIWTAVTLCWGVYVHIVNNRMMAYADVFKNGKRPTDQYTTYFIALVNTILATFLILEPLFIDYIDTIIVVNVFYNVYLATISYAICGWWRAKYKTTEDSSHSLT